MLDKTTGPIATATSNAGAFAAGGPGDHAAVSIGAGQAAGNYGRLLSGVSSRSRGAR